MLRSRVSLVVAWALAVCAGGWSMAARANDDEILAKGFLKHAHQRMITFGYEILNAETSELLASGETKHIFLRDGKPIKVPAKYRELFGIA